MSTHGTDPLRAAREPLRQLPGMEYFLPHHRPDIGIGQSYNRNCPTVSGHKLHLESLTGLMAMHDGPNVTLPQAAFVEVMSQHDRFEFPNHVYLPYSLPGYAVMNRGQVSSCSMNQTVRTQILPPRGVSSIPSIMYLSPWRV